LLPTNVKVNTSLIVEKLGETANLTYRRSAETTAAAVIIDPSGTISI
jgi:hypothetical protein